MKIQIDIPDELNKNLKLYKVYNDLENLQEGVIKVLEDFFNNPNWIDGDKK